MSLSDFLENLEPKKLNVKQEIAICNFNDLLVGLITYYKSIEDSRTFTPIGILKQESVLKNPKIRFTYNGNSNSPIDVFSVNITYSPPPTFGSNIRHRAIIELYLKEDLKPIIYIINKLGFNEVNQKKERKKMILDVYLLPSDN